MGRRQIEIKKIEQEKTRLITFHKRRRGLLKKAMELSILCDCQVKIIVTEENGDTVEYQSSDSPLNDQRTITSLTNDDYPKLFPPPPPQLPRSAPPKSAPRQPKARQKEAASPPPLVPIVPAPAQTPTQTQTQAQTPFVPVMMPNMMPYGFFPGPFMPPMFLMPQPTAKQDPPNTWQQTNTRTLTHQSPIKPSSHEPPLKKRAISPQPLPPPMPLVEHIPTPQSHQETTEITPEVLPPEIEGAEIPFEPIQPTEILTQMIVQEPDPPVEKSKIQGLRIQIPGKNTDLDQAPSQFSMPTWSLFSPGPLSLGGTLGSDSTYTGLTPFSMTPRTPTFGQFYSLSSPRAPQF